MLRLAEGGFLLGEPTDGGRVEEDLRAAEGGEARGLGVPLVPANEHADVAVRGPPGAETQVAGGEVEFLLEARVLGDVHLAVLAEHGAVGVDDGRGVVVDFAAARLEERGDDDDTEALRGLGQFGHRWAGLDGLGEVEVLRVLVDAEILRREHLLEADDFGALGRRFLDAGQGLADVRRRGVLGGELDETDADGVSHGAGRQ